MSAAQLDVAFAHPRKSATGREGESAGVRLLSFQRRAARDDGPTDLLAGSHNQMASLSGRNYHPRARGGVEWLIFRTRIGHTSQILVGSASAKCLISLAPRPGLEPGTYGLTAPGRRQTAPHHNSGRTHSPLVLCSDTTRHRPDTCNQHYLNATRTQRAHAVEATADLINRWISRCKCR